MKLPDNKNILCKQSPSAQSTSSHGTVTKYTKQSDIVTVTLPASVQDLSTEALAGTHYELLTTKSNMSIMRCEKHNRFFDSDIDTDCPDCEYECEYCGGTGEVATDEDDGEGHIMRGVGTQKCICQYD